MSNESYRFKVGAIECIAVSDGTFAYAPDAFIANEPVERFEQELRDHNLPAHEVISPYTCPTTSRLWAWRQPRSTRSC